MLEIKEISSNTQYSLSADALMIPVGYSNCPTAFETSAIDVLTYLKAKNFNIDILSSPESFTTVELNSNLIRLGKFVVKDIALPCFISIMAAFIYDNYVSVPSVDSNPVKVSIQIEVADSANNKVVKMVDFEVC